MSYSTLIQNSQQRVLCSSTFDHSCCTSLPTPLCIVTRNDGLKLDFSTLNYTELHQKYVQLTKSTFKSSKTCRMVMNTRYGKPSVNITVDFYAKFDGGRIELNRLHLTITLAVDENYAESNIVIICNTDLCNEYYFYAYLVNSRLWIDYLKCDVTF
ncbi:unnamed protein product [Adineta ricciae]|uniref:Uncharacterized protein n=1 Tax=Adineta ricciae TaxID=249248 RepID=A0A814S7U4_ADIRI|nr:unnamed protein product [Adineta ricciae]CAF1251931.1 unnamed protein product [Adineta ricciae]